MRRRSSREAPRPRASGAAIAACLAPGDADYFVLKPKHSAFFATPLDLLLRHLRVRRLLLSGVAGDQCVLLTAIEARMQDYDVAVPGGLRRLADRAAQRGRAALSEEGAQGRDAAEPRPAPRRGLRLAGRRPPAVRSGAAALAFVGSVAARARRRARSAVVVDALLVLIAIATLPPCCDALPPCSCCALPAAS